MTEYRHTGLGINPAIDDWLSAFYVTLMPPYRIHLTKDGEHGSECHMIMIDYKQKTFESNECAPINTARRWPGTIYIPKESVILVIGGWWDELLDTTSIYDVWGSHTSLATHIHTTQKKRIRTQLQ